MKAANENIVHELVLDLTNPDKVRLDLFCLTPRFSARNARNLWSPLGKPLFATSTDCF